MELSVESSCQYVTWKVRDFFELPSKIGYSLDSPEFRFADDSYCMRLYPGGSRAYQSGVRTELELARLTSTFPQRNISCKFGYRCRENKESEYDSYSILPSNFLVLMRSELQKSRDIYVPDDTLTVLCSMRLKEPNSAGSQQSEEGKTSETKEEQNGLTGQFSFVSSLWWPFKMELSTEWPCQHVTWKVPDFFQLLSKIDYSLNSPEFRFADDRYCLRFHPKENNNGNTSDADLQLVRLTSTLPQRIVLYKVGFRCIDRNGFDLDVYKYSDTLMDEYGFCLSLSQIEESKDEYVPHRTLTVLCSMCLKEQSSAGSPQSEKAENTHAKETEEGLPGQKSVTCAVQREVPDNTSCVIETEVADILVDKSIYKDVGWSSHDIKGVAVLSERMKQLLIKDGDHDVTISVQNKEFRAHRNILSVRSPVFAMMLAHDTKESNTGTISIQDCDPESFDEFLLYVYSGRTENLTPENAVQLYYSADKYDFPELKERCVSLLKSSLSVESFCDVVLLAAKHQEKELLKMATGFFARNMKQIVVTVSWQKFLAQNPVEANELIIKSTEILHPED